MSQPERAIFQLAVETVAVQVKAIEGLGRTRADLYAAVESYLWEAEMAEENGLTGRLAAEDLAAKRKAKLVASNL